MSQLTLKQNLFVEAYLGVAHGNATEAARMAGYKGNDVTLATIGAENLRKPQIASRVRARVDDVAMSSTEVLSELTKVGRADWRDFVSITKNKQGEVLDATLLLRDKIRALELLGKYHKLFVDQLDVKTDGKSLQPIVNVYAAEAKPID